ncbi:MAG: hypothetical protein R3F11_03580 [Verrucomicrobiales bacterium]
MTAGDVHLKMIAAGADGFFESIVPSTGAYVMQIRTDDLPAGHGLTTDNIEISVFPGVDQPGDGNDFGRNAPHPDLGIGNLVFSDHNANGRFDVVAAGGEADRFTHLLPGNFDVLIPVGEFASGRPLFGKVGSPSRRWRAATPCRTPTPMATSTTPRSNFCALPRGGP